MKLNWRVKLGIILLSASVITYLIVYIIFRDIKSELFYIGIDFAFLPLEILIVALIVEAVITAKEKSVLMEKLNMVIGAFFSEVGTEFLKVVSGYDINNEKIRDDLRVHDGWDENKFKLLMKKIGSYKPRIPINKDSISLLEELKGFMGDKREFMVGLLENPILLEHETFTDMLWALFHFMEELEHRGSFDLPESDYRHLQGDIERAYKRVIHEWLRYMEHMMKNYPYLFSLAMRTNPFDPDARIEVV